MPRQALSFLLSLKYTSPIVIVIKEKKNLENPVRYSAFSELYRLPLELI